MKKFKIQYEELQVRVSERLAELFEDGNGVKSKHSDQMVIQVPTNKAFNLEDGRYLTEIALYKLIDNEGYSYSFSAITLEQLCGLVDTISLGE